MRPETVAHMQRAQSEAHAQAMSLSKKLSLMSFEGTAGNVTIRCTGLGNVTAVEIVGHPELAAHVHAAISVAHDRAQRAAKEESR